MIFIPKTIHHVWPGHDAFRYPKWRLSWLKHNPDWSLRFHRLEPTGDSRVDRVLHDERYTVTVKSNLLRWQVLYEHGGIYVDTDAECLRPLTDAWTNHNGLAIPRDWPTAHILSPSVMACARHHYLAAKAINGLLEIFGRTDPALLNHQPHIYTGAYDVTDILGQDEAFLMPAWFTCHEAAYWLDKEPFVEQHWTGANVYGWQRINRFSDGREEPRE